MAITPNQTGLGNGRFNGGAVVISNNTGQPIAFQVRAWSTFAGATFAEAAARTDLPTRYLGVSAVGEVTPATNGSSPALFGTSAAQIGGFVLLPGGFFIPPETSISAPSNGSLFAALADVVVSVSAHQPDGYLSWVYLLTNGVVAGQISPGVFSTVNFPLSNLPAGYHTLRSRAVNNGNGLGTESAPVIIRVAERPVLEFARGSNGPIQFQFNSATGINYIVESGILTNFSPVITNAGTANPITYSGTNGSATQRTYRVRLE